MERNVGNALVVNCFIGNHAESDRVGIAGGMPELVAWKVVEMNDIQFDHLTPEQRYSAMLAWVERNLTALSEEK